MNQSTGSAAVRAAVHRIRADAYNDAADRLDVENNTNKNIGSMRKLMNREFATWLRRLAAEEMERH